MSTMNYGIRSRYGEHEYVLHEHMQLDTQARIVIDLVTRWGLVAATPDGEDSTGRAKLRLATPEELVDRAMKTTDLLVEALKKGDHILMLPELPAQPPTED